MRIFKSKRAQGALEFLMTYGWAFLVILIMIGALAYFGVLSPTKFLPERCTFGSQFMCKDYILSVATDDGSASVLLQVQNNLGQAIYVVDTDATTVSSPEGFNSDEACTMTIYANDGTTDVGDTGGSTPDGTAVGDGGYFYVQAANCATLGGMVEGTKYKVNVDIVYYAATSSSSFAHTVSGEIFANVEAS
jgi:uncharacterized protein (UPF0333 family)